MACHVPNSNCNIEYLISAISCPVSFEPLTRAVSLLPCMHKVNEEIAKKIYGVMHSQEAGLKEKKPCILCRKDVVAYYNDHFTRGIVKILAGSNKPDELIPAVSATIEADLKEKSVDELPFPGRAAKFTLISGDWKESLNNSGSLLSRILVFKCVSTIKDPLFKEFSILGYNDGKVFISLETDEHKQSELRHYFDALGINVSNLDLILQIRCDGIQAKKLFAVIAKHNEIPNSHFPFIRKLIEVGDWRRVGELELEDEAAAKQGATAAAGTATAAAGTATAGTSTIPYQIFIEDGSAISFNRRYYTRYYS